MLTHCNWKFEKFLSQKISSNDLKQISATSSDNVNLLVEATVVWHVDKPGNAARRAADTMQNSGVSIGATNDSDRTLASLTDDVLKQARASLAMFIGELRYMDTFHMSSTIQEKRRNKKKPVQAPVVEGAPPEYSSLHDKDKMAACVAHANETTSQYGVLINSINIISANPADKKLSDSLAKGALAAAAAERIETEAHANAKASRIKIETDNRIDLEKATAEAKATVIEAKGVKAASDKIEESKLASELQRLKVMNGLLPSQSTFFFGADGAAMNSVMSNAGMIKR